jgi:hypothetical protein
MAQDLRSIPSTGLSPAFILIPDISGFTNFVSNTEIDHAGHIISELLEVLIDQNDLGLQVSEIEGDAVLFYRFGEIPSEDEILKQAQKMYLAFHNHLQLYEHNRICHCGACSSASSLGLKVVAHPGEAATMHVKGREKLLGEDVIIAHRLLKNDVPQNEYILNTQPGENQTEQNNWQRASSHYPGLGEIEYAYQDLSPLRNELDPPQEASFFKESDRPITIDAQINAPIQQVYEWIHRADKRILWNEGIDRIDEEELGRVGSKHVCVIKGKEFEIDYVAARSTADGGIELAERNQETPVFGDTVFRTLLWGNEEQTDLRFEIHPQSPGLLARTLILLVPGLLKLPLSKSFKTLKQLIEAEGATMEMKEMSTTT